MASEKTLSPVPLYSEKGLRTYIVRTPSRPFTSPVWESLIAYGTALHIPEQRRRVYSNIKDNQELIRVNNDELKRLIDRLSAMSYPMELDAVVRKDLLVDLQALRGKTEYNNISARQLMANMIALNIVPKAEQVDAQLKEESGTYQFCKAHKLPMANWRDTNKE